MAYNIEYYHSYYDIGGTQHRVDLLQRDYSGGETAIQSAAYTPVRLRHMGSARDMEDIVIMGRELVFTFRVARADSDTFDSLLESAYKDYRVDYKVDGVLKFRGWVKPENITKEFLKNGPHLEITLSATDGLADLKDQEFLDSNGDSITETTTKLQIIKYALDPLDIDLDFRIHLNTYESEYMTSDECSLEHMRVDTRRFAGSQDGRTVYNSCWDVIRDVLKIYNCVLRQVDGYYEVFNPHELDSYYYEYDWETLSLTSASPVATSKVLDVSSYQVEGDTVGVQKIPPLDKVGITFRNKDLGGDVTGMNLDDWANAAVWTIDFSNGSSVASGVVSLNSNDSAYDEYVETTEFAVTKVTENDYLKVSFDHILESYTTPDALKLPMIEVRVTHPDASTETVTYNEREIWQSYESPLVTPFKVKATGNYKVGLYYLQPAGPKRWDTATFKLKNFAISKIVADDEGNVLDSVVYDEYYSLESGQGIQSYETEVRLADAGQITEIGAILFEDSAEHITSSWNSYGSAEQTILLDIYACNILNNRYEYKNLLHNVKFVDRSNTIEFNNILTIDSRNYFILSYDRDMRHCFVQCTLIELLTTEQSAYGSISRGTLDTINGDSATSSTNVTKITSSTSIDHNELEGIAGSAAGYHISAAQYTNVGNLDTMAYEAAADYYTAAAINTWRNGVTQTEMGYLHGVTSDIQTQIDSKDNYNSWDFYEDTDFRASIGSGGNFSLKAGTNVNFDYDITEGYPRLTVNASSGVVVNAYKYITDGLTTAEASGEDTFKLRTANNLLSILVTSNDGTHGDNALFTVEEGNINHNNIDNTHNLTNDIDHNTIANTHNLTNDIDHNQLTNYNASEHFLMGDISVVDNSLSTGVLKVTTGTGALSSLTLQTSISNNDGAVPTSGAVVDYVSAQANPIFKNITDGTNTAQADSTTDTFRLRSANNLLSILVTNDQATYGDNALFTIEEGNISHNSLSGFDGGTAGQYNHLTDVELSKLQTLPSDADNYSSWSALVDGGDEAVISSGEQLNFIGGDGITLSAGSEVGDHSITITNNASGVSSAYTTIVAGVTSCSPSGASTLELESSDSKIDISAADGSPDTITFAVSDANINHNALLNYSSNRHFLMTDIDHLDTGLSTGLVKNTTGTGAISIVTDNSSNWNTAYGWGDHSSAGYMSDLSDDLSPTLGGDLALAADAYIKMPSSIAQSDGAGIIITGQVDVNGFGIGCALGVAADGHWESCDANVSADFPCSGLALESGTGAGKKILLYGVLSDADYSFTQGLPVYVSTTDGGLTTAPVAGTGDTLQRVGVALDSDTVLFTPSLDVIEID